MFVDDQDPRICIAAGARMLSGRWPGTIRAALVSGSGFTSAMELGTCIDSVSYNEIQGLPISSVPGHGSDIKLVETRHGLVIVFTGRAHVYEGHSPSVCATHAALAMGLGCANIVLMNACGGLNPKLRTGSFVLPVDVINYTGRHIASAVQLKRSVVDKEWTVRALQRACDSGLDVHAGTYVQVLGPSYETRAEIRMMRRIGADIIGMSTAVEAIWAASTGANVCILSLVTNTLSDALIRALHHDEVVQAARFAQTTTPSILDAIISTSV